jgi:hypothetical protein
MVSRVVNAAGSLVDGLYIHLLPEVSHILRAASVGVGKNGGEWIPAAVHAKHVADKRIHANDADV